MLLRGARCENVKLVMEAASNIYESLEFTEQAAHGLRQYVEWKARAFAGVAPLGVTVITRNDACPSCHLEPQQLSPAMTQNQECKQEIKGQRRHNAHIDGGNRLSVILQKSLPGWRRRLRRSRHIFRDRRLACCIETYVCMSRERPAQLAFAAMAPTVMHPLDNTPRGDGRPTLEAIQNHPPHPE